MENVSMNKEKRKLSGGAEEQFYEEAEAAYFSPEKGNIVFCSALDCWSFRVSDFAEIFADKLEIRKEV